MEEKIIKKFREKFPHKLFTLEQLEDIKVRNERDGSNLQPYPANEEIETFIKSLINK